MKSQSRTTYPEQREPDSLPQNILKGLSISSSTALERVISIVPNSTEAKEICQLMGRIWNRVPELKFVYYSDLKELEDAHDSGAKGTDLAIVFSQISSANNSFSYTIMTEAGGTFGPPGTNDKVIGLDTCRKNKDSDLLEFPSSCPVNGYFYSGFLALQYLADQALLNVSSKL